MKKDKSQLELLSTQPSPLEKIVIDNIRRIRREKNISQLKLSMYCGTSASYIGLMETYKNIPKLSTIERIAEALNVPVIELLTDSESADTENKNSANNIDKKIDSNIKINAEKIRKQKVREHLKKEIMEKMSNNLDEILQLI